MPRDASAMALDVGSPPSSAGAAREGGSHARSAGADTGPGPLTRSRNATADRSGIVQPAWIAKTSTGARTIHRDRDRFARVKNLPELERPRGLFRAGLVRQ